MGIIGLIVYFGILTLLISGFVSGMSDKELEIFPLPNMRVPDFIGGYHAPGNESYDLRSVNVSGVKSLSIDAGEFNSSATYGMGTVSSGLNRVYFTTTEDINNERINTYTIYNPNHYPYKLFLSMGIAPAWINTIELQAKTDGYYLYLATMGVWYTELCRIQDAGDPTSYDDTTIQTYYRYDGSNPMKAQVGMSVLNPAKGTTQCESDVILNSLWYGGWEVTGAGFFVTNITTNVNNFADPIPAEQVGGVAAVVGTIVEAVGFVVFILGIVFMPWGLGSGDLGLVFVDGVFFKLPLFALFILGVAWLKPIGAS